MTPAEAAEVLAVAATFDRRTLSELDARMWAAALPRVDPIDAQQAVIEHYADTSEWLMPSHIKARVKAMRHARLDRDVLPAPPAELADDQVSYNAWLDAEVKRIASGKTVARAIAGGEPDPDVYERGAAAARAALQSGDPDA